MTVLKNKYTIEFQTSQTRSSINPNQETSLICLCSPFGTSFLLASSFLSASVAPHFFFRSPACSALAFLFARSPVLPSYVGSLGFLYLPFPHTFKPNFIIFTLLRFLTVCSYFSSYCYSFCCRHRLFPSSHLSFVPFPSPSLHIPRKLQYLEGGGGDYPIWGKKTQVATFFFCPFTLTSPSPIPLPYLPLSSLSYFLFFLTFLFPFPSPLPNPDSLLFSLLRSKPFFFHNLSPSRLNVKCKLYASVYGAHASIYVSTYALFRVSYS